MGGEASRFPRPVNLFEPVDEHRDQGAHGIFDDKAGGFPDRSFLKSLPDTARISASALGRTAGEKRRTYQSIAAVRKTTGG